ncbi:hypothetical protein RCL_jg16404.t1 [Rhizophagus clarus]|uniref:Uncharacterized protein n=1 Tax=Rhizophagus clarus TaxID=94130 RepID=A0A8H3M3B9_9GLOM|nr:hypothetical protein RCL_jg16404.t1 [Rhizophagus clarus]
MNTKVNYTYFEYKCSEYLIQKIEQYQDQLFTILLTKYSYLNAQFKASLQQLNDNDVADTNNIELRDHRVLIVHAIND